MPPADWYPDPWHQAALRWWDGGAWTWNVSETPPSSQRAAQHLRWAHDAVPLVKAALAGLAQYLIRHDAPSYPSARDESDGGSRSPRGFVLKRAGGFCSLLTADGKIWEQGRGRTAGFKDVNESALLTDRFYIGPRFIYVSFLDGEVYAGYRECGPEPLIDYLAHLALAMNKPTWYADPDLLPTRGSSADTAPLTAVLPGEAPSAHPAA
ncbi:MAG TPA: DUF2510 domain-containing protein [Mycobacterium sp.]|nr:DUF2510 domain-containing protein [Mycobacterium sp.]